MLGGADGGVSSGVREVSDRSAGCSVLPLLLRSVQERAAGAGAARKHRRREARKAGTCLKGWCVVVNQRGDTCLKGWCVVVNQRG